METILITGGCGFIGTNLIPRLFNDYKIVVVDNLSHGTFLPLVHGHDNVQFYETDITEAYRMSQIFDIHKPDFVFHFAGLVSIYDCNNNPNDAVFDNVYGSTVVFNECLKHNVKRVIFSESSAVYENCELLPTGFATHQSDPTTVYAATKAAVATLAESLRRTKGLNYVALRYFNVAGPLQDYKRTVPPLFAGVALRIMGGNAPIVFGDGNRRRDFIHVDDVNDFHIQCLSDDRVNGRTFNLGLGQSTSLHEIIAIVAEALGKDPKEIPIQRMPEINGEAFEIFADISNTMALGWAPKKTIKDAIVDTIEYLKMVIVAGEVNPDTYMTNLNIEDVKI